MAGSPSNYSARRARVDELLWHTRPREFLGEILRTRRDMVENCIVRGLLVAGAPMGATNLFALWQKAEATAMQPTPAEVLGPFFKKGAPNATNLQRL